MIGISLRCNNQMGGDLESMIKTHIRRAAKISRSFTRRLSLVLRPQIMENANSQSNISMMRPIVSTMTQRKNYSRLASSNRQVYVSLPEPQRFPTVQ